MHVLACGVEKVLHERQRDVLKAFAAGGQRPDLPKPKPYLISAAVDSLEATPCDQF